MPDNNTHIVYTARDIQRYLEGKMSNGEMHAIEKAALDDPLLAEAIEGYAGVDEKDWSATLTELSNKIAAPNIIPVISIKNQQRRQAWRVAAAVVVLLSGAGMAYFFATHKNKDAVIIAEQHAKSANSDVVAGDIASDTSVNQLTKDDSGQVAISPVTKSPPATSTLEADRTPSAPHQKKDEEAATDFVYTPKNKAEQKPVISEGGVYINPSADNTAIPTAPGYNNNAGILSNQASSSNALSDDNIKRQENFSNKDAVQSYKAPAANNNHANNFKGRVVAKDNTPLAFAQVNTSAARQPVYTDKNGFFKVTSPDTVLHAQVNSAGYESKTITIGQSDVDKKVVLEPLTIAEEKFSSGKTNSEIVVSKSRMERKKEIEEQEEEEATPVNGWEDYNNYLSNNGSISDKNMHGVVEVFVNLDKNGAISRIKVDKSLCAECDAEAVRLVKEGPKWDVKTNKARKVKIKVKF